MKKICIILVAIILMIPIINIDPISEETSSKVVKEQDLVKSQIIRTNTTGYAQKIDIDSQYAYIADKTGGIALINIQNPYDTKKVIQISSTYGSVDDICVYGNYVIIIEGSGAAVSIIDIQNPDIPIKVFEEVFEEANQLFIQEDVLYVTDGAGGLAIYDISDPLNPSTRVSIGTVGYARDVFVSDNWAFITCWGNGLPGGIAVINISDPLNPIGPYFQSEFGGIYAIWVNNQYAYTVSGSELRIFNVTNPTNCQAIGELMFANALHITGDWENNDIVYVLEGYSFAIINVSDPFDPYVVKGYETNGFSEDAKIANGYAYIANGDEGLAISDVSKFSWSLTFHSPFSIDGDFDLENEVQRLNWIGSGTLKDPYLIKGLNITSGTLAIDIRNTQLHIKIINCVLNGSVAIFLENLVNCYIIQNRITYSDNYGIQLENTSDIMIQRNDISCISQSPGSGIRSYKSEFNDISYNIIHNNIYGIFLQSDNYSIVNNWIFNNSGTGIYLQSAHSVSILRNNIQKNQQNGIHLSSCTNNYVFGNFISENDNGIIIAETLKTKIKGNILAFNLGYGIWLDASWNNSFSHNAFVNNSIQAYCTNSLNDWNDTNQGNYWSDWNYSDSNGDGIIDTPRPINGIPMLNDSFPLLDFQKLSPLHLISPLTFQIPGNTVLIKWTPAIDYYGKEIHYSVFYSDDNGKSWLLIEEGLNQTAFIWDISGFPMDRVYKIKIRAICSNGLTSETTSYHPYVFTSTNIQHIISDPVLLSPNGGEILSGMVIIQWSGSIDSLNHDIIYKIEYSNDGGQNWNLIGETNATTYTWDTTKVLNGFYLLKISANCPFISYYLIDFTDENFTINNAVSTLTSIIDVSSTSTIETAITMQISPWPNLPIYLIFWISIIITKKRKT